MTDCHALCVAPVPLAMEWGYLITSTLMLGVLAVVFAIGLAVASKLLHVTSDPRIEQIEGVLPNVNCGACGFGGCSAYAKAVVAGQVGASECVPGGLDVAKQVAAVMGLQAETKEKRVAVILCQGGSRAVDRFAYEGITDCRAAVITQDAAKGCRWACVGLGSCAKSCPFDAIVMGSDGLPKVIEEKCTACGTCVDVCPKNVIEIKPAKSLVQVLCRNHDKGADVRKVCPVGCIACKKCEQVCPVEGKAIHVADFVAKVDVATCISCGKCVQACPTGAIGSFRLSRQGEQGRLPSQEAA